MATLSKGYTFGSTEQVTAAKLHTLIDSGTVTGIVNADITNSTIQDAKIYSVSGSKFTSLANIPAGSGDIPKVNLDGDWDTDGTLAANSDVKLPTQKAVKTYADTSLDINAKTEKTTLHDNDLILIEDSEASNAKKKAKKSNLTPGVDDTTIEISSSKLRVKDAGISQAKLKTTTGEVSVSITNAGNTNTSLTLPGGEYGFYIQTKLTSTAAATTTAAWVDLGTETTISGTAATTTARSGGSNPNESYVTRVRLCVHGAASSGQTVTHLAQQRYVTSSGRDHWIFLLIAKKDFQDGDNLVKAGSMFGAYQAPDHPSYGNGGDELIIPHPFGSYDKDKHEIVVVDNSILTQLKPLINHKNSLLTLINNKCLIDDTKRPKYEPREIIEIDEYGDLRGEVIKRGKTPDWAKIKIMNDEYELKRRMVEKLPNTILYKEMAVVK